MTRIIARNYREQTNRKSYRQKKWKSENESEKILIEIKKKMFLYVSTV